jgi:hypothetical protein
VRVTIEVGDENICEGGTNFSFYCGCHQSYMESYSSAITLANNRIQEEQLQQFFIKKS